MYDELPRGGGSPFGNAHPVMLLGILFFVLPFFKFVKVLSWIPGWLGGIGIAMILVGAGLSIMKLSRG